MKASDMLAVRYSKVKSIAFVLGALLFGPGGVWMGLAATETDERVVGWFLAGASLLIGVQFLRRMLDETPKLTLSKEGFLDHRLGIGLGPWDAITGVSVHRVGKQDFVSLTLRDPEKYLHGFSKAGRVAGGLESALGFGDLPIGCVGLDHGAERIAEAIRAHIPENGQTGASMETSGGSWSALERQESD